MPFFLSKSYNRTQIKNRQLASDVKLIKVLIFLICEMNKNQMRQHKANAGHRINRLRRFREKRRVMTPNVITAFGLCCGLFIIFKSVLKTTSSNTLVHQLQGLSLLLISAMIADFSDGAVARIMKAESSFGAHFDSLSDAITFGIAPPLLAIESLKETILTKFLSSFLLVSCIIYTLCGVLRLVRYNVFSKNTNNSDFDSFCFTGLPIPAAAAAVVSLSLFLVSGTVPISNFIHSLLLAIGMLLIGCLMISPWKFPSMKSLRFKISSFFVVIITGLVACLFFLGLIDHFIEVFFLSSWSYIVLVFPLFSFLRKKL